MTRLIAAAHRSGFLAWFICLCLLWAMLSAGQGWYLGLPTAFGASVLAAALRLPAPRPGTLLRLPRFMVFFLRTLWHGGWDVARRALSPNLPIAPAWEKYQLQDHYRDHPLYPRLRLLLSAMVGLLPGTLSTHYDEHTLTLHVLDERQDWRVTTLNLEQELARLLEMEP
ncbi:MAG: Na+/H+ antiporter subunit E [Natronospirillum sp.]|uniref:Na+/H+ antiporter subunit E n=1 Tax=Natronospirillum sp. TaxID=2812955 RepID=UPI0025F010BB|nr:Na+/H+ antiporter subunit E [Natronospirillum sp.]MCH8551536.1 Na+/H+ antiporter subunit E [Natronospirillum sp.]